MLALSLSEATNVESTIILTIMSPSWVFCLGNAKDQGMTKSYGSAGDKPDNSEHLLHEVSNPLTQIPSGEYAPGQVPGQLPEQATAQEQAKSTTENPPDINKAKTKSEIRFINQARIAPGVRLVAVGIDFLVCYFAAVFTTILPYLNRLLELQTVMIILFIARDYFFGGRGFGKNLMGLQVVDASSGNAPTLFQSFMRNVILIAPLVLFQIVSTGLKFLPIGSLTETILELVKLICTVYVVVVIPIECYRAFIRPDSVRKGDEMAGTTIIEAPMEFSHLLPPPKS
jgi:uncharacterized RDD family membrane protein YckC